MFEFDLPDMTCGHCVQTVTKTIMAADPKAVATVNLAKRKAMVATELDPKTIASALDDAGYPATVVTV